MSKGIFIAVEGPIGVGKTTLSTILKDHFKYSHLREIIEENPFLSKFYENIEEYALQTEAFFLFNRIKQLEDLEKTIHETNGIVSDYYIIKNLIFAKLTLNEKELKRYNKVFDIFIDELFQPDIIVYLNADLETLMKRIALRDRNFERKMDIKYMEKLKKEYENYFLNYESQKVFNGKKPVLITIDNSLLDVLDDEKAKKYIVSKVEMEIKKLLEERGC